LRRSQLALSTTPTNATRPNRRKTGSHETRRWRKPDSKPSVPRKTPAVVVISGLVAPPSPLRQAEPTRAPLSKPWSSHAVLTVRSGLFQR
jgi:hypothetical protein